VKVVHSAQDIEALSGKRGPASNGNGNGRNGTTHKPVVLSLSDLYEREYPLAEMLIEGMLPARGASMSVGCSKSGKTLLACQQLVAVASGAALFGFYKILTQGAAMTPRTQEITWTRP